MKTVDIIIPTYKPNKEFIELVKRLELQTYPINKILIINTEEKYWNQLLYGHKNNIADCKKLKVTHHSKREFDHGRTRNAAAKNSNADIIVFMTQDAIPRDNEVIGALVEALSQETVAIAYARQIPNETCGVVEAITREFNYPDVPQIKSKKDIPVLGIKTYFCSNVCAAYKRQVYMELGGFVKKVIFNEDMIFAAKAIKAGYEIAYVAGAQVIHSHNYTNKEQFRRNFDVGVSQAAHPEVFEGIPSESEGIKLVKATRRRLIEMKKGKKIFPMYLSCAYKLVGYKLGKNYKILPKKLVKKWSMNKEYWNF